MAQQQQQVGNNEVQPDDPSTLEVVHISSFLRGQRSLDGPNCLVTFGDSDSEDDDFENFYLFRQDEDARRYRESLGGQGDPDDFLARIRKRLRAKYGSLFSRFEGEEPDSSSVNKQGSVNKQVPPTPPAERMDQRMFSQAEVEEIVTTRLSNERSQWEEQMMARMRTQMQAQIQSQVQEALQRASISRQHDADEAGPSNS